MSNTLTCDPYVAGTISMRRRRSGDQASSAGTSGRCLASEQAQLTPLLSWLGSDGLQVIRGLWHGSDEWPWSSSCLGMEVIYAMKLKSITYAIRVPECWLTTWLHLQLIWRCKSPKLCKVIIHLASCTLQGWEVGFSVPLKGGRYAPVTPQGWEVGASVPLGGGKYAPVPLNPWYCILLYLYTMSWCLGTTHPLKPSPLIDNISTNISKYT